MRRLPFDVVDDEQPARPFSTRGVHGRAVYIDPKAEMVIARFASHPLAVYQVVAEPLLRWFSKI